jgi:hypothetical protein
MENIMNRIVSLMLLFVVQLSLGGYVYGACLSEAFVDCKDNCSWGYNAATDSNFPKAGTIAIAQAAANAAGACTSTVVEVYGTEQITAAGYANYFFDFTVGANGVVAFDGDYDVSHDQKALPPSHCALHACSISFEYADVFYGVDGVIYTLPGG